MNCLDLSRFIFARENELWKLKKKLLLSVLGQARRPDPARLGRPSRRPAEAHLGPTEPARLEAVASLAMPPPPLGRRAGHARHGHLAPIKPRPSPPARTLAPRPRLPCLAQRHRRTEPPTVDTAVVSCGFRPLPLLSSAGEHAILIPLVSSSFSLRRPSS
jgi:hypothetical protein